MGKRSKKHGYILRGLLWLKSLVPRWMTICESAPFPQYSATSLGGRNGEKEKREGLVILKSKFPIFTMKWLNYTGQCPPPESDFASDRTFFVVKSVVGRILLASSKHREARDAAKTPYNAQHILSNQMAIVPRMGYPTLRYLEHYS